MNAMRYLCILLFVFQLTCLSILIGQPVNNYIGDYAPASPNVAAMNKYTDIPISHFTGVPNISFPIYTVQEGPLSVPISLSYHASGVKVAETASWVGLGWSLSTGGSVSRTIVGFRDDEILGYMTGQCDSILQDDDPSTDDMSVIVGQSFDCEPDVFQFSFGGYSGKMKYGHTLNNGAGGWYIYPRSDLKVQEIRESNNVYLLGFIFTTPSGIKYTFGNGYDERTATSRLGNCTSTCDYVPTSWCLTNISSADDVYQISFHYTDEWYKFVNLGSNYQTVGIVQTGSADCPQDDFTEPEDLWSFIEGHRLTSITTSSNKVKVEFIATDNRQDLDVRQSTSKMAKELKEIQIKSGDDDFCKGFQFSYLYSGPSSTIDTYKKRLILKSFKESECGDYDLSGIKPPYTFQYNDIGALPHRKSKRKDHWGYYNGAFANDGKPTLIPYNAFIMNGNDTLWYDQNGANRESNQNFMAKGVLKKITYPTQGTAEFEYASNTEWGPRRSGIADIIVQNQWTNCDAYNNFNHIDDRVYMTASKINNSKYRIFLDMDANSSAEIGYCDCQSNGAVNYQIIAVYSDDSLVDPQDTCYIVGVHQGPPDPCVTVDLGYQPLSHFNPPLTPGLPYKFFIYMDTIDGDGSLYFDIKYLPEVNNTIGGLRVEKVTLKPIVGEPIVTTYDYHDEQGRSTGQVLIEPQYGYTHYFNGNGIDIFIRHFNSFPLINTADINGYIVGYENVIQRRGLNEVAHTFKATKQSPVGFPAPPLYPIYDNGALLSMQDYAGNELIQENQNIYEVKSSSHPDPYSHGYRIFSFNCTTDDNSTTFVFPNPYLNLRPAYLRPTKSISILDGIGDTTNSYYSNMDLYTHSNRTERKNSDGSTINEVRKYAPDLFPANHFLNVNHMIDIPLETKVNDGFVGGSKVEYSNTLQTGVIIPHKVYSTKSDGSWKLEKEVLSVNANGYPTSIGSRTQLLPTNLIWSADPNKIGQLDKVIHGIRETKYIYKNRLQLDSIINYDGLVTTYKYDAIGRLSKTTDRNGNRKIEYTYGFGNPFAGNNWIKTRELYTPSAGSELVDKSSFQYFDGLGRMVQTVYQQHSQDQTDVIHSLRYDSIGRITHQYEPFDIGSTDGGYHGAIPPNTAYTVSTYENSSMNRVLSVTPPGWYPTTYSYGRNSGIIQDYQNNAPYPVHSLYQKIVTDPNGVRNVTYTDKRGRNVVSDVQSLSGITSRTHYLYDDRDRLVKVLPPDVTINEQHKIYQYQYDTYDRMISKKIPGKLSTFFIYDYRDLVVFMKDGIHYWETYTHDEYERLTDTKYNGISVKSNNYDGTNLWEIGKKTFSSVKTTGGLDVYQRIYYDVYGRIDSISGNHHLCPHNGPRTILCRLNYKYKYDFADNILEAHQFFNLPFKSTLHTLDSTTYDHAGRMVDHYFSVDGEKNKIANQKYTIKDQLEQQNIGAYGDDYLQNVDFAYLANGFLKKINQYQAGFALDYGNCFGDPGGGDPENLSGNPDLFYLELGYDQALNSGLTSNLRKNGDISQMIWQSRGRPRAAYGFQYDYLNRLTDANYESIGWSGSFESSQANKYDAHINYEDKIGNIASITRRGVVVDTTPCVPSVEIDAMSYSYHSGTSKIKDISDVAAKKEEGYPAYNISDADYQYDANGNMTYDPSRKVSIIYNHLNLPDSLIFDDGRIIANLYDHGGNKLAQSQIMADGSLAERRDYIANLELVNGELQVIHHDQGRVVKQDGPSILVLTDTIRNKNVYFYANEILTSNVILEGSDVTFEARDSIAMRPGFFVNDDGSKYLAQIDTIPPDTNWRWEYYIKDHLGNIRISFADLNKDGNITVSLGADNEILEENHYYPFGMKHDGPWLRRKNLGFSNKYNYNAKEEMPWTGYLYYGARQYDPSIGRFLSVDPLADQFPNWTSYHYVHDNPLKFTDPTGMYAEGGDHIETKFVNEQGVTIAETNDGSDNVFVINASQEQEFIAALESNVADRKDLSPSSNEELGLEFGYNFDNHIDNVDKGVSKTQFGSYGSDATDHMSNLFRGGYEEGYAGERSLQSHGGSFQKGSSSRGMGRGRGNAHREAGRMHAYEPELKGNTGAYNIEVSAAPAPLQSTYKYPIPVIPYIVPRAN